MSNLPDDHRRRLSDTRASKTHTERLGKYDLYVTVAFFEDGSLGEVYTKLSKHGSDMGGMISMLAMTISVALQYGTPWSVLERKFSKVRFGDQFTNQFGEESVSLVDALRMVINRLIGYEPPAEGAGGVFAPLLPFTPPQSPAAKEIKHEQDRATAPNERTGQPGELAGSAVC